MEEKLRALEGITYSEWKKIKIVVENRFSEIKEENTLKIDENVLLNLKIISD